MYPAGLWIRILFLQIRIQLFSQCGPGSSFKNFVKITLWRVFWSSKDKKTHRAGPNLLKSGSKALVSRYLQSCIGKKIQIPPCPDEEYSTWYCIVLCSIRMKRGCGRCEDSRRASKLDIVLYDFPLGRGEVAEDARTAAAAAAPQNLILYCMMFH